MPIRRRLREPLAALALTAAVLIAASGLTHAAPPNFTEGDDPSRARPGEAGKATITGATVTAQLTDAPVYPMFKDFAAQLPQAPIQLDPVAVQYLIQNPPADEPPLAQKIRAALRKLAEGRAGAEPRWRDGLNPAFWWFRTKGNTREWWAAYKRLPPAMRPVVQIYPLILDPDVNTPAATPQRANARKYNNQALDLALGQGNAVEAAALLDVAAKADPTYPLALYNAGVLQLVQQNFETAARLLRGVAERGPTPRVAELTDGDISLIRKILVLKAVPNGDQKRIYADNIDGAFALVNAKQYAAAVTLAGQAATLDTEEDRPEAHLIGAMVSVLATRPKEETVRWVQRALERASSAQARKMVKEILDEANGTAAAAAAASAATPAAPPTTTPPATEPPANPPTNPPATQP